MASPRSDKSKSESEAKKAQEERVVYMCANCGAVGQTIKVMQLVACQLCFNEVEPFIGYRRENDGKED